MTKVSIIGSGIAGAALAASLCARDFEVSVLDQADRIAAEGSGNPTGLITPYLASPQNLMSRIYGLAFEITLNSINKLCASCGLTSWQPCGALQLPSTERFKRILNDTTSLNDIERVNASEASKIFGAEVNSSALFIRHAGIVSPPELCNKYLTHPGISLYLNKKISSLHHVRDRWILKGPHNEIINEADIVIVANAHECAAFEQTRGLRVEAVKGQVAIIPTPSPLESVNSALCYNGYMLPQYRGENVLGASFEHGIFHRTPSEEKHKELFFRAKQWSPIFNGIDSRNTHCRVSFRTSTHDRLPYVGRVPNEKNLYVSVGHGSRGLVSSHLGAELITSMITDENSDLVDEIGPAFTPGR